jgi:elongation factor P--beta-lysine ligase
MEIKQSEGKALGLAGEISAAVRNLRKSAGIALGNDRLVMLFCDTDSIDDFYRLSIQGSIDLPSRAISDKYRGAFGA